MTSASVRNILVVCFMNAKGFTFANVKGMIDSHQTVDEKACNLMPGGTKMVLVVFVLPHLH